MIFYDYVYFIVVVNIMYITNIAHSVDFNYFMHIMDLEHIVVVITIDFMAISTMCIISTIGHSIRRRPVN